MKVLELFGCSGGLAAGFRAAGLEITLAVDRDTDACASYEINLGVRPLQMDIRDLIRLLRAGWNPGPWDLIVADPPCSPWSRAGKRKGLGDARDLLRETVEAIELIRPRAYLIGNIPGLQDSTHWPVVQATIGRLAELGYCVQDFAVLDAVNYGVPQFRERPYWYGHLGGRCIAWPAPTHAKDLQQLVVPGVETLPPWVSVRQAIGHLPVAEMGRPVKMKEPVARLVREKMTRTKGMRSNLRIPQSARLGDPAAPAATLTSRPARSGSGDSVVLRWPWDRPSTTVMSRDVLNPPGHHATKVRQMPNAIVLSETAAAILQGFPESWRFVGATKASRWAQLGQAVPPLVAQRIAQALLLVLPTADGRPVVSARSSTRPGQGDGAPLAVPAVQWELFARETTTA